MNHPHQLSSPRLSIWVKKHPTRHRTIQQGHQIVCPSGDGLVFKAKELELPPSRVRVCPLCFTTLSAPEPIPGEHREVQWRTAA